MNDDGSVPTDNPVLPDAPASGVRDLGLGLRNPYTFAVQPGSGRVYINDVGESDLGGNQRRPAPAPTTAGRASEGPEASPPAITAPLFAYRHAEPAPPGSGAGRLLQGFAIAGGAFYPGRRPFPDGLPRPATSSPTSCTGFVGALDLANDNAAYAFAHADRPGRSTCWSALDGALYVLTRSASRASARPDPGLGVSRRRPRRERPGAWHAGPRRGSASIGRCSRRARAGGPARRRRRRCGPRAPRRADPPGRLRRGLFIGHAEHAAQVRTAGHLDLEPGQGDALVRGLQRDRRRRARSDAGAKEPPGVTPSPLPANSAGMSVAISVPLACVLSTRVPLCHRAVAGASSCRPFSGRRCSTDSIRSIAAAIACIVIAFSSVRRAF